MKRLSALVTLLILALAGGAWAAMEIPDGVKGLLQKRCTGCHFGKNPPRGLNLEPANVVAILDAPSTEVPTLKIIDTKSPGSSYLLKKVRRGKDIAGSGMPPPKALTAAELQVIEAWLVGPNQHPFEGTAMSSPGGEAVHGEQIAPAKSAPKQPYDKPAFWGTRLVNLPTTTTPSKGDFLLRISHRFSEPVDAGFNELFGLDSYANILVGFGYGITDNLQVTVGRARVNKEFEFGADWLIAKQGLTGRSPLSLTLHGGLSLATEGDDSVKLSAALSLSRQVTSRFSVMAVPAFASNTNYDPLALDPEGTFSLGLGARYMIVKDLSVIAEWVPVLAGYKDAENGWGLGLEKKIGKHVFQFFVTNAFGLTTSQFISGGDLGSGGFFERFRIGFNIFRTF
jgi:hypothetical protein